MKRILWICLLLLPVAGRTQDTTYSPRPVRPPFTLKTAPLEPVNFFQQSVALRADVPLASHWNIELGASLVFNSWTLASAQGESYRGIKWRSTVKYYFDRSFSDYNYLGLTIKYNDIDHEQYVNVFRQGHQYTEWILQRRHLETWGLSIRYGIQNYWGNRKRWMVETFWGGGFRQTRVSNDDLPPDAENRGRGNLFSIIRPPGNYTRPDIVVGVYIGWLPGRH